MDERDREVTNKMIDEMICEKTEVDGQRYFSGTGSPILGKLSLRPKLMVSVGETDNAQVNKVLLLLTVTKMAKGKYKICHVPCCQTPMSGWSRSR